MKILIQVTDNEILDQLDKTNIGDYAKEHNLFKFEYTKEELFEMLREKVENDNSDIDEFMVNKLETEYLVDHMKENLNYFVSDDISKLMTQIDQAGLIDETKKAFRRRIYIVQGRSY